MSKSYYREKIVKLHDVLFLAEGVARARFSKAEDVILVAYLASNYPDISKKKSNCKVVL